MVTIVFTIFFSLYYVLLAMGLYFIAVVISFAAATILIVVGLYYNFVLTNSFLRQKDLRIGFTMTVIKNLKFVKSKALEYFYHFKIYLIRDRELMYLRYLFYLDCLVGTVSYMIGVFLPTGLYFLANFYPDSGLNSSTLT